MKTILVTGGCGFIGSNLMRYLFSNLEDIFIVNVDKLTYAGNASNLEKFEGSKNYAFCQIDISNKEALLEVFKEHTPEVVLHLAAESHVDRSIQDASLFITTNVLGTQNLIDLSREFEVKKFLHISTDEVYGSILDGKFTEGSPLKPSSPYSASKAASDLLILAAVNTHNFPGIVLRCSNNYGPYQYPEKFIPLVISNALGKKPIPVFGDGKNVRDWIYVEDHCAAIACVLEKGIIGEIYNVGSSQEKENLEVISYILEELSKRDKDINSSLIAFVKDRPGHDRRYAINAEKLRSLGWMPKYDFARGMQKTLTWYIENLNWVDSLKSSEKYQEHYKRTYQ